MLKTKHPRSDKVFNTQTDYFMNVSVWSCVVTCSSRLLKGHLQAEQTIFSDTSLTRLVSRSLSSSGDLSSNSMWKEIKEYFLRLNINVFTTATIHTYLGLQAACRLFAGRGSLPSARWKLHHLGTSRKWSGTRQKSSLLVFFFTSWSAETSETEKHTVHFVWTYPKWYVSFGHIHNN